jgi:hypothetical protein
MYALVLICFTSTHLQAGVDNDDVKEARTYLYDMVEMKRAFNIDFASVTDDVVRTFSLPLILLLS